MNNTNSEKLSTLGNCTKFFMLCNLDPYICVQIFRSNILPHNPPGNLRDTVCPAFHLFYFMFYYVGFVASLSPRAITCDYCVHCSSISFVGCMKFSQYEYIIPVGIRQLKKCS